MDLNLSLAQLSDYTWLSLEKWGCYSTPSPPPPSPHSYAYAIGLINASVSTGHCTWLWVTIIVMSCLVATCVKQEYNHYQWQ